VNPRLRVAYEPHLLPPSRFVADHVGHPFERPEEDEKGWTSLLVEAEILFDFDRSHLGDLPERAPLLKWIQATSAGIDQLVAQYRYAERMPETLFTTASGVHAIPLAEYAPMSILMFRRRVPEMLADQRERRWEPFASTDLTERSLAVVGMGSIGRQVAGVASEFGMWTIGVKRTVAGVDPDALHLDALYGLDELHEALRGAEHVVLRSSTRPRPRG
jgi:glyoxylate/hydroxypyruvate reductase A